MILVKHSDRWRAGKFYEQTVFSAYATVLTGDLEIHALV